jgi:hypothetical protein
MFSKEFAEKIDAVAREEIAQYGLPTERHYNLSMQKGLELASKLHADENLVKAGVALMDIKLGYAAKVVNDQPGHVKYCVEFAETLLKEFSVGEPYYSTLINCVAAHHKVKTADYNPFETIEAEIVANADCYRFIHPRGVMSFHATAVKRGLDHDAALKLVESKLDEKYGIMTLREVKAELEPYYKAFKEILNQGRD